MEWLLGVVVFILDVVAIVSVLKSGLEPLMKLVWVVLILALPVVGMALWFLLGARTASA